MTQLTDKMQGRNRQQLRLQPLLVLNIVGLSRSLIGENTPFLQKLLKQGQYVDLLPSLPAVTCTVQSSMLTGSQPSSHGIVANGWYNRELAEVHFWKQSNRLVKGEMIWDAAKRRATERNINFRSAQLFWWFNMYSSADISVTPRPIYRSDGRKIPAVYSFPGCIAEELTEVLGTFPLFKFWGPMADITSTNWIKNAAMHVHKKYRPELHFVYLPHLDYNLQRFGPHDPRISEDLQAIDGVAEELFNMAEKDGVSTVVLSEYGIEEVNKPIDINRELRRAGFLRIRDEQGHEMLDPGASDAFAVADHQVAHVYLNNCSREQELKDFLLKLSGVSEVLGPKDQEQRGIHHERSGNFVVVAAPKSWFTYYFWLDESKAPDYARTVNIHAKPGYDPVELLIDPRLRFPKLSVARRLARQKAGMRGLMDVIGTDASIVKGSHGRMPASPDCGPVFITKRLPRPFSDAKEPIPDFAVKEILLEMLFL